MSDEELQNEVLDLSFDNINDVDFEKMLHKLRRGRERRPRKCRKVERLTGLMLLFQSFHLQLL